MDLIANVILFYPCRVLIAYAYTSSENTASKADGEVESMNKEKEMVCIAKTFIRRR